jgi:hypothetical protein
LQIERRYWRTPIGQIHGRKSPDVQAAGGPHEGDSPQLHRDHRSQRAIQKAYSEGTLIISQDVIVPIPLGRRRSLTPASGSLKCPGWGYMKTFIRKWATCTVPRFASNFGDRGLRISGIPDGLISGFAHFPEPLTAKAVRKNDSGHETHSGHEGHSTDKRPYCLPDENSRRVALPTRVERMGMSQEIGSKPNG